jgi:hypothetical protein
MANTTQNKTNAAPNKGFHIPPPSDGKTQPGDHQLPANQAPAVTNPPATPANSGGAGNNQQNSTAGQSGGNSLHIDWPSNQSHDQQVQPREYIIAGGVLVVLIAAFFFAKRAYANYLAGKRVAPGAASAAGWWLFIFLTGLAVAAILSILNADKFVSWIFLGPLAAICLLSLILMFITGRRS